MTGTIASVLRAPADEWPEIIARENRNTCRPMSDLFTTETRGRVRREEVPDLWNLYAQERHGMPRGWAWDEVSSQPEKVPPGFIRLVGAVCPIGPRTGRPDWKKRDRDTVRTVFIDKRDFEAWKLARAERLGICAKCNGTGERWVGWNHKTGSRYKTCPSCGGSGDFTTSEAA